VGAALAPLPQPPDGLPLRVLARREPDRATAGALETMDLSDPFSQLPEDPALLSGQPRQLLAGDELSAPASDGAVYLVLDGTLRSAGGVPSQGAAVGDVVGYAQRSGAAPLRYRAESTTRLLPIAGAVFDRALRDSDLLASEAGCILQRRYLQRLLSAALPGLDLGAMRKVLPEIELWKFQRGDVVFHQGDAANHICILLSGELAVVRQQLDGSTHRIGRLGDGETFGEIGVLHGRPRSATMLVESPSAVVLAVGRRTIQQALAEAPVARQGLALMAGQRLISWIETLEQEHRGATAAV
jgi:CRP-like cAMP-binding protein